ncbi:MAG: zinc metallopeptidase [Clostridia bacterium]|nr:zinc metallopeptidase [Clostridia bacterium]
MDYLYLILVLPAVIFSLIASAKVKSTYNKYSQIRSKRNLTGADAARAVLNANGIYDVRVEHISGELTDNYDPKNKVIHLSDSTYNNYSVAALGVAAHEAGHAVQHNVNYLPIRIRSAIIPITQIGSKLAIPLILIGVILSGFGQIFITLAYVGIVLFATTTVFQLVTLPTEFNASNRALKALKDNNLLYSDEIPSAKKVLSAAAMTYVAALAVSVTQLLRLLLMVSGSRRR